MRRTSDVRACADWPSGDGRIVSAADFLAREGVQPAERAVALIALAAGRTWLDPRGRWSLTPIP